MTSRIAVLVAALIGYCIAGAHPAAGQVATPTASPTSTATATLAPAFRVFLPVIPNDRELPLKPLVQMGGGEGTGAGNMWLTGTG